MPSHNPEQGLRPQLSAGQMAMVAVGGSIGTGLLLGASSALSQAGPAVLLSFLLAACINFTVSMAMGELACVHPAAGSFGVYGDLYLNQWAGFVSRAGYWAAIAVSIGAELVASSTYMAFWFPTVPALVWGVLFALLLYLVNLGSVGSYGRFEFWFAMIKLATLTVFIVAGAALLLAGRVPAQYTAHGGFFPRGLLAPLLGMTVALYSFGGVEMVAVTTGEARSIREVPRAVLLTFLTLTLVYLGAMAVLAGIIPWDQAGSSESPFVTVFRVLHIPAASHLMNFVVLTAALSGANAALYIASRMLFSLARTGWAPAGLGQLNPAGSPRRALLVSSFGILLAVVLQKSAPQAAFLWILQGALFGLLLSWLVSLLAHVVFRLRLSPDQVRRLPLRSPLGLWGSVFGFLTVGAVILRTWVDSPVALVSGLGGLAVLSVAYHLIRRRRTISE